MKLSKDTVEILSSFSKINQSILITPGNELRVLSPHKTVLASAHVNEVFIKQFGIYDIKEFLGALSLFEDYNINFMDTALVITSNKNSIRYNYAHPDTFIHPTKKIEFDKWAYTIQLSDVEFKRLIKAALVLQSEDIMFVSEGEKLIIRAGSIKNSAANRYDIETNIDAPKLRLIFKLVNLQLLDGFYTIKLSTDGLALFENTTKGAKYWIRAEG